MRYLVVTALALGMSVPALAGETVTEHETYEKRSMKVETMQAPTTTTVPGRTERTVEETETTRTDRPRIVEKRTTVVPGDVVRERKTETETHEDD